ncbi:hypothetical protein C8J56DRAFT_936463 [Mycena floridula]|nr:hypothetical protein C8J56DRAFT_936463 [Mycena floridula]
MQFSVLLLALLPLVAAMPAEPVIIREGDVGYNNVKRATATQGNVFVTKDINFGGDNTIISEGSGQCVNVPSNFNDAISMTNNPWIAFLISIFSDANCNGSRIGPIRSPGVGDLTTTSPPINDAISSQACFF